MIASASHSKCYAPHTIGVAGYASNLTKDGITLGMPNDDIHARQLSFDFLRALRCTDAAGSVMNRRCWQRHEPTLLAAS